MTAVFFFFFFFFFFLKPAPTMAVEFIFNSFPSTANTTSDILLIGDATLDSNAIRLTNDSDQFSIGRAFYKTQLPILTGSNISTAAVSSFSTSFVFSILPRIPTSPGFGLAFVLTNSTSPPGALTGQYFGLFSNVTRRTDYPLFAVEFDTGRNPEFNEQDGNHVGIDLNYITSSIAEPAGYYLPSGEFRPVDMRSGRNIRAWIEFDGQKMEINVTIAPAEITQKPERPLINYTNPKMRNFLSPTMFVGFSASKVTWVEVQRVLAWSLSNTGSPARDINTANLPDFLPKPSSSNTKQLAGVISSAVIISAILLLGISYYYHSKKKKKERRVAKEKADEEEDNLVLEDWEMEYWPRRFTYEDLSKATNSFSGKNLLGIGGFGKVYKARLVGKDDDVAVKCISHDSKQGIGEFMAEMSSMGRLQHKNLVTMRGWCRRGNVLILVYDFMPNGSLDRWIFPTSSSSSSSSPLSSPSSILNWDARKQIILDVAEGLLYLHEGWEKVVLHRDIKPGNILIDRDMRGKLGDFGLAKLLEHDETSTCTRVVGTIGYLAPELARVSAPTKKSDVYSFGVVILAVCCGRRAIEMGHGSARAPPEASEEEEEEDLFVLVDWTRRLYREGRVRMGIDPRMIEMRREEEIGWVIKLGLACCHPDSEQRPTMKEVVEALQRFNRR